LILSSSAVAVGGLYINPNNPEDVPF